MSKRLPEARKYTAPALDKGLDILELLASTPNGLSLTELSHELGRTTAELYRVLSVLNGRHYIQQLSDGSRYRLTTKMFQVSHRFAATRRIQNTAAPFMKSLAADIQQIVHLVVYSLGGGLIVAQEEPPECTNQLILPIGGTAPLLNSCAGHVLLAFTNEEQRQEMLNSARSIRHDSHSIGPSLMERLNSVRSKGYESISSPVMLGVWDLGTPVFDRSNSAVAVLMISFLLHQDMSLRPDTTQMAKKCRSVTREISMQLGQQ